MAHPTVYNTREILGKFQTPSTLKDAGVSTYLAKRQLADGLIEAKGKASTGQRGRPAVIYGLTLSGALALDAAEQTEASEDQVAVEA